MDPVGGITGSARCASSRGVHHVVVYVTGLAGASKTRTIKFPTRTKYFSYLHEFVNYYLVILLLISNALLIFLAINFIHLLIFF